MSSGPVVTFVAKDRRVVRFAEDESFAEASGRLPAGVYTSFRTYGGERVLRFPAHLRRLANSARLQGTTARIDGDAVRRLVSSALGAAGHRESRARVTVTPSKIFVSVAPFVPPAASLYREGASCVTLGLQREKPRVKDTRFVPTAAHAYSELPLGVEEGLLRASDGSILEGLTSNFFAVVNDALHTEEARVLSGVTRALVLEVAGTRLPVVRQAVRNDQVSRLSEAFITSASREVLPVVCIDDRDIGAGHVGPHTLAIMTAFSEAVDREAEPLL